MYIGINCDPIIKQNDGNSNNKSAIKVIYFKLIFIR